MSRSEALHRAVQAIRARPAPPGVAVKIVAIDGHGGAGKTTLAAELSEALGDAPVLHTDDFASPEEPIGWWPRLIAQALEPLAAGRPATFVPTDWEGTGSKEVAVGPAEVVFLEGVTASRKAFRPFITFAIWVEAPADVRLRRGLERDGEDARGDWERWVAQEDAYVERERPREHADLIISGD